MIVLRGITGSNCPKCKSKKPMVAAKDGKNELWLCLKCSHTEPKA